MIKIIFCTSLLVTNIVSALGSETFFYDVTVTRKNILQPSNINITTKLYFQYLLTATSDNNLTFLTAARNPTFDVYRDGAHILNGETCEEFATPLKELVQPFLIIYNDDQTFKAIRTRKDEDALVKNVKLIVSSLTQVDASKINETETEIKTQAQEVVPTGKCNIDYDAKRNTSASGLSLELQKHYGIENCTREPNKQAEEDAKYLETICNSEKESKYEKHIDADLKLIFESVSAFVTNTNLTDASKFNPLKNSDAKVTSDMHLKADILTRNNTVMDKFDESGTIDISQESYRPVNRSLLENDSETDPKLQELFKSFACEASLQNSDYDILERIITCLSKNKV